MEKSHETAASDAVGVLLVVGVAAGSSAGHEGPAPAPEGWRSVAGDAVSEAPDVTWDPRTDEHALVLQCPSPQTAWRLAQRLLEQLGVPQGPGPAAVIDTGDPDLALRVIVACQPGQLVITGAAREQARREGAGEAFDPAELRPVGRLRMKPDAPWVEIYQLRGEAGSSSPADAVVDADAHAAPGDGPAAGARAPAAVGKPEAELTEQEIQSREQLRQRIVARVDEARDALKEGRHEDALASLAAARDAMPPNEPAFEAEMQDLRQVRKVAREAKAEHESALGAVAQLIRQKRWREARELLLKIVKRYPWDQTARADLDRLDDLIAEGDRLGTKAHASLLEHNYQLAEQITAKLREVDPEHPVLEVLPGRIAQERRDHQSALDQVEQLLEERDFYKASRELEAFAERYPWDEQIAERHQHVKQRMDELASLKQARTQRQIRHAIDRWVRYVEEDPHDAIARGTVEMLEEKLTARERHDRWTLIRRVVLGVLLTVGLAVLGWEWSKRSHLDAALELIAQDRLIEAGDRLEQGGLFAGVFGMRSTVERALEDAEERRHATFAREQAKAALDAARRSTVGTLSPGLITEADEAYSRAMRTMAGAQWRLAADQFDGVMELIAQAQERAVAARRIVAVRERLDQALALAAREVLLARQAEAWTDIQARIDRARQAATAGDFVRAVDGFTDAHQRLRTVYANGLYFEALAVQDDNPRRALAALRQLLLRDPSYGDARALYDRLARRTYVTNDVGMEFVWIEPGSFDMMDDFGRAARVTLSEGFYMAVTEVTQAQWRAVMRETPPVLFAGHDRPVENVTWRQAVAFCQALSERDGQTYRLPTEAQWEYACRAGSQAAYSFGDSPDGLRRYANLSAIQTAVNFGVTSRDPIPDRGTASVAYLWPNAWGLYDMHGNVAEWCADWQQRYLPEPGAVDPTGPATGVERVVRGGSWEDPPSAARSSSRRGHRPDEALPTVGFRVIRLAPPSQD